MRGSALDKLRADEPRERPVQPFPQRCGPPLAGQLGDVPGMALGTALGARVADDRPVGRVDHWVPHAAASSTWSTSTSDSRTTRCAYRWPGPIAAFAVSA